MTEYASKLNFKCTDYNLCTRVTVYSKCIYAFLSNLVLVAEYHIDC